MQHAPRRRIELKMHVWRPPSTLALSTTNPSEEQCNNRCSHGGRAFSCVLGHKTHTSSGEGLLSRVCYQPFCAAKDNYVGNLQFGHSSEENVYQFQ